MTNFIVGTCIVLHGYYYKIIEDPYHSNTTYILSQQVVVFEETRVFFERFKKTYVNKNATKSPRPRSFGCMN